jgi:hypothetical protein
MHPLTRRRAGAAFFATFSTWLWGAVELFALARSRWSARVRGTRRA